MSIVGGIIIDYGQVFAQASAVRKCAQSLKDIKSQLDSLIAEVGQGWRGDAATEFLTKCEALSAKIDTASTDVDSTADAIIRAATLHREAEDEATKIAHGGAGRAF